MQLLIKFWGLIKSPGTMATLTIVGFAFGIWGTLFYEKRHALAFEIISNASVYDVRENLNNLQIFYAGQNLRAEKKTLRLISLRIVNSGETHISKGDYDEAEPLGFSVQNGKILESPKFIGSNSYLNRHIKPTLVNAHEVRVAPVILDAGEYIEVQTLVLTPEGVIPQIRPLGKISGIKNIEVSEPFQAKSEAGIWSQIWDANSVWIHVARAPVYSLLAMLLIALFVGFLGLVTMPFQGITDSRRRRLREAKISEHRLGRPLTVADQFVREEYTNNGEKNFGRWHQTIEYIFLRDKFITSVKDHLDEETVNRILKTSWPIRRNLLAQLESSNLVRRDGAQILVEPDLVRALNELAEFLGLNLQELGKVEPERLHYEIALAYEEGDVKAQGT